jgi:hypothetical protein
MGEVIHKQSEHNQILCSLIKHLYKRSSLAPVKTEQGNECIVVNMDECSQDFLLGAEDFFVNSERFQILIMGKDYYVEVLNGDSFTNAYNESM